MGRIVHRITAARQGESPRPAQRAGFQALQQVLLQGIVSHALRAQWRSGQLRHHRPSHRMALTLCIDEDEGVDAVVRRAGEAVARPVGRRPGTKLGAFGVCIEELLDPHGVVFACPRVRPHGTQLLVEILRRAYREHRRIVHRHAPLLAIGLAQQERHAAHRYAGVCGMGIARAYREPPQHRYPPCSQQRCPRQRRHVAAHFEIAAEADAARMGAAVSGMDPGIGLHAIDQLGAGEPVG